MAGAKLPRSNKINIKGYKWIENDREDKQYILISDNLNKVTTEGNTTDEYLNLETKWIELKCRAMNIVIGVVYASQENTNLKK